MKAIVLTLLSCVLLGGVYAILNKHSSAAATAVVASFPKADTSTTLDDSHWLDDETFQKAVQEELLSNAQDTPAAQEESKAAATPYLPKMKVQEQPTSTPNVRQLILELHPDTTGRKVVLTEVV